MKDETKSPAQAEVDYWRDLDGRDAAAELREAEEDGRVDEFEGN